MLFIKKFIKNKAFIIAEIGVNHNGELKKAKKLVDAAIACRANAVKFQTFFANKLASKFTPKVKYQLKNSQDQDKETHYEMLKKLEFNGKKFNYIKKYCKKKKITFISTPYDLDSAKFLIKNGFKIIKIASADLIDLRIHKYLGSLKNVEIILSTGMANFKEIKKTLSFYKNKKNIILMQCISNYPSSKKNQNLNVIKEMAKKFKLTVGYSDHTSDHICSNLALASGAKVFEKHFTIKKNDIGPDHKASCNIREFKYYVKKIRETETIMGSRKKFCVNEEMDMKNISRKSIFAVKNLKIGEKINEKNINTKRPGKFVPADKFFKIIGKKAKNKINKNQPIKLKDLN